MRIAVLLAALLLAADPAKDLGSKDVKVRLDAIERIAERGHEDAEALLVRALDDKDWEVQERAAIALASRGGPDAVEPLVELALEGPTARVRRAAARSLGALAPGAAFAELLRPATGKLAVRAWEAARGLLPARVEEDEDDWMRAFEKARKHKEAAVRDAAAEAFLVVPSLAADTELVAGWFEGGDVVASAAALELFAEHPEPAQLEPVLALFGRAELTSVLERRAAAALAAMAGADGGARDALDERAAAVGSAPGPIAARWMRLAERLARGGAAALSDRLLATGVAHEGAAARAAALFAIARLEPGAHEGALLAGVEDGHPRVRATAVRALAARGLDDADRHAAVVAALGDADPAVREDAALALARDGDASAAEALARALSDPSWEVAAVAAVSLGKTHLAEGVEPLVRMLASEDWRRRGAAAVGLTYVRRHAAVPPMIGMLEDPEPAVARTAWLFLRRIAKTDLDPDPKAWTAWWDENGESVRFVDTLELKRRRDKYGYSKTNVELFETLYQELDVVVLDSRGDHIQDVLEGLGILHRMTTPAHHAEDAIHPGAVYVSNCTGEVEPADLERLAWFVRTGGYLFGSCWSLSKTIAKIAPGIVRKLPTGGEVLDDVEARPCLDESPYFEGVFEAGVRPIYKLEGAHLIDVLDPERAEVLIDSPECASRWGGGDLAAWFRVGHGLVLDSVNHFELQGLAGATHLKKPEERQAYAFDHMGLDYRTWRATRKERWWGSNGKAAREVDDLTAFRFLTNFVRRKRLDEE